MDWLKELLKSKGLAGEQTNEIVKVVESNYKGYVSESRFKEASEARKQLELALIERDKQLEELTRDVGSEKLQEQIKELQHSNQKASEQYETSLKELRMNAALTMALHGKVHDVDVTKGLIDTSKITLDENGAITSGFDDQLKALRESKAFLFVSESETVNSFKGFIPFEGKTGEPKIQNFGEMLAQNVQKGNEGFTKAQEDYFK